MQRIVVIEDDLLMRSLLVEWLGAEGYRVDAFRSNDVQPQERADLVILDVFMPRHCGTETLRMVRDAYPNVPIIAMSGRFGRGLRCAGSATHALGVAWCIPKPFDREALLQAVRGVMPSSVPQSD